MIKIRIYSFANFLEIRVIRLIRALFLDYFGVANIVFSVFRITSTSNTNPRRLI